MLLKRGILPVMAILTSLHSYGAINKTNNGTASATMKKGLTLAMTTPFGNFSVIRPTSIPPYITPNISCNATTSSTNNCSYDNLNPNSVLSKPTSAVITITGDPSSTAQLSITKNVRQMNNGLLWDTTLAIDMDTSQYLYTLMVGAGTGTATITLSQNGTSRFMIGQKFSLGSTLSNGTATGTYTITVTYV